MALSEKEFWAKMEATANKAVDRRLGDVVEAPIGTDAASVKKNPTWYPESFWRWTLRNAQVAVSEIKEARKTLATINTKLDALTKKVDSL